MVPTIFVPSEILMFKPNPNAMLAGGQALRKLRGYEGSALMNGPGIFKRSEREPAAWPCVAYKNTAKRHQQ